MSIINGVKASTNFERVHQSNQQRRPSVSSPMPTGETRRGHSDRKEPSRQSVSWRRLEPPGSESLKRSWTWIWCSERPCFSDSPVGRSERTMFPASAAAWRAWWWRRKVKLEGETQGRKNVRFVGSKNYMIEYKNQVTKTCTDSSVDIFHFHIFHFITLHVFNSVLHKKNLNIYQKWTI